MSDAISFNDKVYFIIKLKDGVFYRNPLVRGSQLFDTEEEAKQQLDRLEAKKKDGAQIVPVKFRYDVNEY